MHIVEWKKGCMPTCVCITVCGKLVLVIIAFLFSSPQWWSKDESLSHFDVA